MTNALWGLLAWLGLVLCIFLLVVFLLERKTKESAYDDPADETDEERADRNFFRYLDKLNKDIDR